MYNHGKGLMAYCVASEGCVEDISFSHAQRILSMIIVGLSLCLVIHCQKSTLPGQGSAIHPVRTPQRRLDLELLCVPWALGQAVL